MFRAIGVLLSISLLISCGSKSGDSNTDSTKAANGISSAFSGGGQREVMEMVSEELESRARLVRQEAASRPTFTCDMLTNTSFCAAGGTSLKDGNGAAQVTCTHTANAGNCDINCAGTGKTVVVKCGADNMTMSDMAFQGTFQKPTCTDDGTSLTLSFCMIFKSMSAKVTFGTLAGNTLSCGAADGSQKMCNTMVLSKTPTTPTAPTSTPSSTSALTCTLDGKAVTMDYTNGKCG